MENANFKYTPELEKDVHRIPEVGYEPEGSYGFLRCLEHGAPSPLIRWHHHKEYELHLIKETSGRMFVGDYIGEFKPGNLVLTGPNLPHNWISDNLPAEGIASRDLCLQFADEPFRKAIEFLPELSQVLPLLERAKNGIEFFGVSEFALDQIEKIKESSGVRSFREFLTLMLTLSEHENYQRLSSAQFAMSSDESTNQFSDVIDYVTENFNANFSMAQIAEKEGMDSSQFSRRFSQASGSTFTSFVNRLRINRACQLLDETDKYISTICYDVGYNTVANFNRRFIEVKKVTPSEYRRQSQKKYEQNHIHQL